MTRSGTPARAKQGAGTRARAVRSAWLLALALIGSATGLQAQPFQKTSVDFPDDPFFVASSNVDPGWVKFTILIDDLDTIIFQDSNTYPFHYDFAVNELPPFGGMTPEEFDAVTLNEAGQLAILGGVLIPPLVGGQHVIDEYGIQLVRQDPYPPELVRDVFNRVKAAVVSEPQVQAFYFPTFEQQQAAHAHQAFFESEGIFISSPARWAEGNACYSHGWALGELKYVEAAQIDAAYLNGSLSPGDLLLTDAVPAEIPFVAGVISLSPSTPSSHVAILAETFGVPFVHLALAADAQRAQDLVGHRMALRAEADYAGCRVRLIDVEGVLDQATIDEILGTLKTPPPLEIVPRQTYGAYSASTDGLVLSDIQYFGGKAANYGLLRSAIPDNSPVAAAFSFDLWAGFMAQTLTGGQTLAAEIEERLQPFAYPPDMQTLAATLEEIRDLIKDDDETAFDPVAEAAVVATLEDPQYGFDPLKKLRFRSSTNVEDSEQFTGAGLYDSYSGCLEDDLDADDSGPSWCDPDQDKERGVFRAIRKVFASFYNFNAYLERLRHGIDESQVGMAVLVHHSFPDALELANGVGTLERSTSNDRVYLVTQDGSSSVTNPEPGAIPEEVEVWVFDFGTYPTLLRESNLVPLGATVMSMPDDYVALTGLLVAVADAFELAGSLGDAKLEFEYKKTAPDDELIVKQVRRIPPGDDTPSVTPFLISEPVQYCLAQAEYGDVFANHRLKSRLRLETHNMWLSEENLQSSFYADADLQYTEVCQLYEQAGPPEQWPEATHGFLNGVVTDGWRFGNLQNPRTYELSFQGVPTLVSPSQMPLLVLSDFLGPYVKVDYDTPVPTWDWEGPTTTTTEHALLYPCPQQWPGERLQQRSFTDAGGGVTIETSFYFPPYPEGAVVGYTAPLIRWVETLITGLTSAPIVLQGEYSQTYRPGHHNFTEYFVFEPALEPGLSQQQLDELDAAGVRAIYVGTYDDLTYFDDAAWGDSCLPCSGFDGDQDGFCTGEPTFDCDDARGDVWSTPGEVGELRFGGANALVWTEPAAPGGTALRYDTLRSVEPGGFETEGVCVEWDDGSDFTAVDPYEPTVGSASFYLVRAENDCPSGQGSLGFDSEGQQRLGPSCP